MRSWPQEIVEFDAKTIGLKDPNLGLFVIRIFQKTDGGYDVQIHLRENTPSLNDEIRALGYERCIFGIYGVSVAFALGNAEHIKGLDPHKQYSMRDFPWAKGMASLQRESVT